MDHNAHVVDACIVHLLANYDLNYILDDFDAYYNYACGDDFDINIVDDAVNVIRVRNGLDPIILYQSRGKNNEL